jgi:hypothetical protein
MDRNRAIALGSCNVGIELFFGPITVRSATGWFDEGYLPLVITSTY